MRKNENSNKVLKLIIALLFMIVVITVIYNVFFERNEEISNTDFNMSNVQKNNDNALGLDI